MANTYPMHIVAAGGLVTNSQEQVLLIKSPRYGDWEFPGGQVEKAKRSLMRLSGKYSKRRALLSGLNP